ncbi:hypothetical protein [Maridesulfovibrio sp.]|uniref:hypothetical protein n=1 Tax=Maridesulfovibrio sp. TaxID=2795000 RepID=UPI0039EEC250
MRTDIEHIREAALAVLRGVVLPRISKKLLAEISGAEKNDFRLLGRIVGQHERMLEKNFSSISDAKQLDSLQQMYGEEQLEHSIRSRFQVERIRKLEPIVDSVLLHLSRLEGELSMLGLNAAESSNQPEVISDTLARFGISLKEYNQHRQSQSQERGA